MSFKWNLPVKAVGSCFLFLCCVNSTGITTVKKAARLELPCHVLITHSFKLTRLEQEEEAILQIHDMEKKNLKAVREDWDLNSEPRGH